MSAYISSSHGTALAQNRSFLLWVSLALLVIAVVLNIIGLNIGKWLQNAGGVGTYVPLLMLVVVAVAVCARHGSVTHFTLANMLPTWNWDTVNFWSQIAFAFTGLELVSCMAEEVRDPRRTLPRAVFGAGALIALMYIAGTFAVLSLAPADDIDPKSGVFHAIAVGSVALRIGFIGVIAAILVTAGNAGGIGSTVAGVARVPFQVGIDRYLPAAFGKIHPRWKTPYISILVQAVISGAVLLLSQINESTRGAYQVLVDVAIILYFIPFLYMFAAVIKLASRKDRSKNPHAVLVPAESWACGSAAASASSWSLSVFSSPSFLPATPPTSSHSSSRWPSPPPSRSSSACSSSGAARGRNRPKSTLGTCRKCRKRSSALAAEG
jgi:glutamate:GABA antiporter